MVRTFFHTLRRSLWHMLMHDGLLVAKAAAYSAIFSLFPAMLVLAAVVAVLPGADAVRHQIYTAMAEILPETSTRLVGAFFVGSGPATTVASVITSSLLSFFAASGVVASLMEGFRRTARIPRARWPWKRQRLVAFALVPLTLLPLALAAGLVVFGRVIAYELAGHVARDVRTFVLTLWLVVRWSVALLTSIAMLSVIYHWSIPERGRPTEALPGASLATALWFPTTLGFGWYVTRFANYAVVYGSLGAGIATLVWLYIVCVAALVGAEFNAELYLEPDGAPADAQMD